MAKEKFDIIQSTCIPIQIDNCNTDLIIPARYLASTTRDPKFFGDAFMHDLRFDAEGEPIADFVMNQPEYAEAPHKGVHEIIVGGQNWGNGSSREHAAWAIAGYGVRVVISSSFADIHRNNLLNCFVLPVIVSKEFQQELFDSIAANPQTEVKVDVPNQTVTNLATGHSEHFDINSYKKYCLMNAYDDIDFLLANKEKIEAYEKKEEVAPETPEASETPEVEEADFQEPAPAPTYVEATTEAPASEPAEEVAPIEVTTHHESEPFVPKKLLPINRGLASFFFLSLITLGIYGIVILSKISSEINLVATRYDGRKTTNYLWILFLWGWLTGGIAYFVWFHCISDRIGNELQRRQIPYSFGASDYWLWCVLGAFVGFLPLVYTHKLLSAMNQLNADYNQKG
ncbi:MAG: 3-isopropylmalate dehydratase small subunit [Bacteroidaceae bacterium]|nr:3-isopropylmalate dehydratase small subunit [Bacteroidaceae bacterium]